MLEKVNWTNIIKDLWIPFFSFPTYRKYLACSNDPYLCGAKGMINVIVSSYYYSYFFTEVSV